MENKRKATILGGPVKKATPRIQTVKRSPFGGDLKGNHETKPSMLGVRLPPKHAPAPPPHMFCRRDLIKRSM